MYLIVFATNGSGAQIHQRPFGISQLILSI